MKSKSSHYDIENAVIFSRVSSALEIKALVNFLHNEKEESAFVVTNESGKQQLMNSSVSNRMEIVINLEILSGSIDTKFNSGELANEIPKYIQEFYKSRYYYMYMELINRLIFEGRHPSSETVSILIYKHLSYWANVLEERKVRKVIFFDVPHTAHEWVLLFLANYLHKETYVLAYLTGGRISLLDSDMRKVQCNFIEKYGEKVEKIFTANLASAERQEISQGESEYRKGRELSFYRVFRRLVWILTRIFHLRHTYINSYYVFEKDWPPRAFSEHLRRVIINFQSLRARKYYEKLAKSTARGKIGSDYVYFPLTTKYEATNKPGYLGWTAHSVLHYLLSITPDHVHIVVKEHPVTFLDRPHQDFVKRRDFYKSMVENQRVRFASINDSQFELLDNAIFTVAGGMTSTVLEVLKREKSLLLIGINPFVERDNDSQDGVYWIDDKSIRKSVLDSKFLDISYEENNPNFKGKLQDNLNLFCELLVHLCKE